jgi:hypothetical protein
MLLNTNPLVEAVKELVSAATVTALFALGAIIFAGTCNAHERTRFFGCCVAHDNNNGIAPLTLADHAIEAVASRVTPATVDIEHEIPVAMPTSHYKSVLEEHIGDYARRFQLRSAKNFE